jgi:transcriptional regulator with XRE-family HTH domain
MFNDWILSQLQEHDWSQADLARASGLTTGAISNYINGRTPDKTALRKLAKAFKLPPETVFRAAGILPPEPDLKTPNLLEWMKLFTDADEAERDEMLNYARYLSNRKSSNKHQTT